MSNTFFPMICGCFCDNELCPNCNWDKYVYAVVRTAADTIKSEYNIHLEIECTSAVTENKLEVNGSRSYVRSNSCMRGSLYLMTTIYKVDDFIHFTIVWAIRKSDGSLIMIPHATYETGIGIFHHGVNADHMSVSQVNGSNNVIIRQWMQNHSSTQSCDDVKKEKEEISVKLSKIWRKFSLAFYRVFPKM
jgi:hypothetical protein